MTSTTGLNRFLSDILASKYIPTATPVIKKNATLRYQWIYYLVNLSVSDWTDDESSYYDAFCFLQVTNKERLSMISANRMIFLFIGGMWLSF